MKAPKPWHVVVFSALLLGGALLLVLRSIARAPKLELTKTVADVVAEHAPVRLAGSEVRGPARLVDGAEVSTGPGGRARLRLDDGSLVLIDEETRVLLRDSKLTLTAGRMFVQGSTSAHTQVEFEDMLTEVSSSSAAFALTKTGRSIYCARGELLLRRGSQQTHVATGERAVPGPKAIDVSPEAAFDDWTGGLAVPWALQGAGRPLVPELFSNEADPSGQRLSVRSEKVDVSIEGEFAVTKTRTSYFNGSDRSIVPQVRVALPESAILSRVARANGVQEFDAQIAIQRPSDSSAFPPATPRLEWAGNGWLRGVLPSIESGASVDVLLTYAEWLPTHAGRRTYRFPLVADEPPLIGELRATVHASGDARFVSANAGGQATARTIQLVRSDFRPSADLVFELAAPRGERRAVRAYVQDSTDGDDPYVLFRAEVPERTESGVSLAIVVDTSMSVGTGALETERAVVEALLQGLGPSDEAVVLAADQTARALAHDAPHPVTAAFREEVARALAAVRPAGASNLSLALERGADLLDADSRGKLAGSGVLIYVGDGKISMGETDAAAIRRRLAQRSGGMPRFASVAVGSGADRVFLARLASGVGTFHEVFDRADAARAGSNLLTDALEPTLRDVDFDLGPNVDRVYPRDSRAIVAGSTLSVVGRLRGSLPGQVGLTFRHGRERVTERRVVDKMVLPASADLPKRWARARIEEIAARGDGLEPAIALAASAGLLTPWTGWFFEAPSGASASFGRRLLDFSPTRDAAFARYLKRETASSAALLEPTAPKPRGVSLREATEVSVRRILKHAQQSVRACRDARAAVRPEVSDSFVIDLALSEHGKVLRLHVTAGSSPQRDAVLERCVEGVLRSLPYAAYGIAVSVTESLKVPPLRAARRTVCSPASRFSLPIRRSVWLERNQFDVESFRKAMQSCELSSFAEKREYLLLMMDASPTGADRLARARELDEAGESDAAAFVRKEALRRVESFEELERLSVTIFSDEPNVDAEFEKAYAAAGNDEARLDVVRKFLRIAPHATVIRRRLYALLEALGRKDELVAAIDVMRTEPIVDAGLLAMGASALRRAGLDGDGRRAFGELLERAPHDPWTLAFVGDRLRGERLFDEAAEAYESLQRIVPADAGVSLRLALAHAGAGRLDVATRLLESVTQTGGRDDDGRLGELASITSAVLLAGAREQATSPAESAELSRRLTQTPLPDVASVLFIRSDPSDDALQVRIARERSERDFRAPEFNAPALGLAAARVERGDGAARIVFSRTNGAAPNQAVRAEVAALMVVPDRASVRLVRREIELPRGATTVELRWNGEAFL